MDTPLSPAALDCSAYTAGVSVPSEKAVWQWMSHPVVGGSIGITYPVILSIVTSFRPSHVCNSIRYQAKPNILFLSDNHSG